MYDVNKECKIEKKVVVFFFCERNKWMFFQFLSEGRQMTLECLYFTLFRTMQVFCDVFFKAIFTLV